MTETPLSSDRQDLLSQARQRTAALLANLERGRGELAAEIADCVAAYAAVIDAARGTLENLDRALRGGGIPDSGAQSKLDG
jgi:hypothetical protein